jgi:hypothetical protein
VLLNSLQTHLSNNEALIRFPTHLPVFVENEVLTATNMELAS